MNDSLLQQKWLQTANGKICYYLAKQFGGQPTVVLLHGLSANHTTWLPAIKKFQEAKFNILAPDLRGHGLSDKTKKKQLYELSVFSDDLKQIIEKENLEKIIFVCYSFGGYIALDYLISHPASAIGLVLISVNHVNPLKYKKIGWLSPLGYWLLQAAAWLLLWQGEKEYFYFEQTKSRGYWNSTFQGLKTMPLSINFWILSNISKLNFKNSLSQISCPTLIVRGSHDPFLTTPEAKEMVSKINQAEFVQIEDTNHFLASRFQKQILEVILNFLQKIIS